MKKTQIKRPTNVEGKGIIKQIEYLRLLHNISKSELCNGICSVSMYNRYLAGADIGINRLNMLARCLGMEITLSLLLD